ncbi:MAG TPA: hypothetical protein VHT68_06240, partial [Pseudolabrys sp.]|nr:hypothetical protein [Pseudolabrys sp.]
VRGTFGWEGTLKISSPMFNGAEGPMAQFKDDSVSLPNHSLHVRRRNGISVWLILLSKVKRRNSLL